MTETERNRQWEGVRDEKREREREREEVDGLSCDW